MEPPPAVPDHPRVKTGGVNPGHWGCFHSYSRATYQKLEVEEQDRRSIPIDDNLFEHDLPWGGETEAGETRGWFSHWRRGVGPTLRGWAKGSKGAVVHMLVVSAQKFGVEDEVGAALGFMPKIDVRRAETCIYAVGRIADTLDVLKWCKTDEMYNNYHAVLGAAAPRRVANDPDPDGMIERVAAELRVTPGKRYAAYLPRRPLL